MQAPGRVDPARQETSFMPTDPQRLRKLQAWVESRWPSTKCPWCGTNDWLLGDTIACPVIRDGVVLVGPVFPVVPLTCKHCAFTVLLHAIGSGLLPPSEPQQREPGNGD
jgi:hypothetical protein